MSGRQSIPPEHEPEAGSSERPSPLQAQMQEAARQIKKTKESISPDLRATVKEGVATFAMLAAEVGRGFAGAIAAAEDFGAGMAEVNRTLEASAKAATAGLDEEDE